MGKSLEEEERMNSRIEGLLVFFFHLLHFGSFIHSQLKCGLKATLVLGSRRKHSKSRKQKVVLMFDRKALIPFYPGTHLKCKVQGRACNHVVSKRSPFGRGDLAYLCLSTPADFHTAASSLWLR